MLSASGVAGDSGYPCPVQGAGHVSRRLPCHFRGIHGASGGEAGGNPSRRFGSRHGARGACQGRDAQEALETIWPSERITTLEQGQQRLRLEATGALHGLPFSRRQNREVAAFGGRVDSASQLLHGRFVEPDSQEGEALGQRETLSRRSIEPPRGTSGSTRSNALQSART